MSAWHLENTDAHFSLFSDILLIKHLIDETINGENNYQLQPFKIQLT